jgi:CRISPR-associated exonuclease Cas4
LIKRNVKKLKNKHNIPSGNITYQDLSRPAKPFFSKRYKITGKPDYIIKKNNSFIPVEVKSGAYTKAQENHILQLAAYCHLIEENYNRFVPYGVLIYSDKSRFTIPFDPKTRFELESAIKNIRNIMKTGNISRNHNDLCKCKKCSLNQYCDFKSI